MCNRFKTRDNDDVESKDYNFLAPGTKEKGKHYVHRKNGDAFGNTSPVHLLGSVNVGCYGHSSSHEHSSGHLILPMNMAGFSLLQQTRQTYVHLAVVPHVQDSDVRVRGQP